MAAGDLTLTVAISGSVTSGNNIASRTFTKTFSSIANVFEREVTVPTTLMSLITIAAAVAGAALTDLNCIVIKNQDPTNYVTVGWLDTGAKSCYKKLKAGEILVLMNLQFECDDDSGATFAAFNDIDTINVQANTSACVCAVVAF